MPQKKNDYKLNLPSDPNKKEDIRQEEEPRSGGWIIKCIISIIGVCGVMFVLQFLAHQVAR